MFAFVYIMYASEGRMKGSGQWPKWDIPIYTTKRRCNFLFLIRYQDYDAAPSYSSKCFHNLEKEVQRIKQHVSGHTAAGRSMPKVQASFPSSSVARLSHWPCVPGELHMLGCERARLGNLKCVFDPWKWGLGSRWKPTFLLDLPL